MIDLRQDAFNSISRVLAITRYDIEQRQLVNDLSLNIHGENYFRDVLNYTYGYDLKNDNFRSQNSSCIDLVDDTRKLAIQITTTRTKEKLSNTLKALSKEKYKNYKVEIFYLLEKANPNKETINEFKAVYSVELNDCLFDYTDLINKGYDIIYCGFMFFTAINTELEVSTYSKYLPVSDPAIRNTLNQFM